MSEAGDQERAQSEDHIRAIFDGALDCVISIDETSTIVDWNRQAELVFGWTASEAVGKRLPDLLIPPAFREAHGRGLKRYLQTGEAPLLNKRIELSALRKNGEEFPVELSIVQTGSPGKLLFTGFLRDITERKQVAEELARRAEALQHANTELEQFAYVSAHDLQEPLRMVTQYMGLLQKHFAAKLEPQARAYIERAVDGATRMHALIRDLLEYSRADRGELKAAAVDLDIVVKGALDDLKSAITEAKANVVVQPLPAVRGDRAKLARLFQNLIANAVKFRGGQDPVITLSAERSNDNVVISVRDNGIGIEPQYAERIFELFQRLHSRDEYPGTGIGLAVCKKIVEQHGGRIWVESKPGEGATFKFTLKAQV